MKSPVIRAAILVAIALALVLVLAVLVPAYMSRRPGPRQDPCLPNLHALSVAMQMYVQDSGRFPGAASWMEGLRPYLTRKDPFHCPGDKEHLYSYAMNSALSGVKPPDPKNLPHVILFFSSDSGKRNASGSPAANCRPHEGEGNMCAVVYADGDAEMLGPGQRPE